MEILDPREQLTELGSEAFRELRPLQLRALEAIRNDYRDTPDLALEMPTGSGKTLVGLMLADEVMRSGRSAVYLTGTIQLSHQVHSDAGGLGLSADVMSAPLDEIETRRRRNVEYGRALGILNYWAFFSDYHVLGPPGLLIIDDAHLAESAIGDGYSITIELRDEPDLLHSIYEVISTRTPGYQVVDDLARQAPEPSRLIQLLAFPHVVEVIDPVRRLLDDAAATADFRWSYRRIRGHLANCLWLLGPQSLVIRPLRFPLHNDERFALAERRLYMSATVSDLADLRRRLGTGPIDRVELDTTAEVNGSGKLMLVMAGSPADMEALIGARERLSQASSRRVWFCRSRHQAQSIADELRAADHRVYLLGRSGAELDEFFASDSADLVIGGRFDGIDFAHERARLAFFPSTPYGVDLFDEFMTANFGRSSFLKARLAERLTQALGRMTRGEDDWAVVVLEDPDTANRLVDRQVAAHLPNRLWREVETALERQEQGIEETLNAVERVLRGTQHVPPSEEWRRPPAGVSVWPATLSDLESRYGDALFAGTFDSAISAAQRLLEELGDHPLRPWWLYLLGKAEYLSAVQDDHAARLRSAIGHIEQAVRAAGPTAWFNRLEAGLPPMRSRRGAAVGEREGGANPLASFLAGFRSPARFDQWVAGVTSGLQSVDHDAVARAWTAIGMALGYATTEPEGPGATDSLWRGRRGSLVFEAKIEHDPGSTISRRDVGQLLGQMEEEARSGNHVIGCFLTTLDAFHPASTQVIARVTALPLRVAQTIWIRVGALLDLCRDASAAGQSVDRLQPPEGWLERLLESTAGRFATLDDLDRVWPRET